MLSFLLLLVLTALAGSWLGGHKARQLATPALPPALTLLLVLVGLGWLAVGATVISWLFE